MSSTQPSPHRQRYIPFESLQDAAWILTGESVIFSGGDSISAEEYQAVTDYHAMLDKERIFPEAREYLQHIADETSLFFEFGILAQLLDNTIGAYR